MAVKNIKSRPGGTIYIPTTAITYSKIQIIDDNGVTHTVLDSYGGVNDDNYTMSASITRAGTNKLSSFSIVLANIEGKFMNVFNGGEYVHIYADSTDATTHIFTGRMNAPKYGLNQNNGFTVNIDGREYPEFVDKLASGTFSSITGDVALAYLFYNDYSTIKLRFWNGSSWSVATYNSTTKTVSWSSPVTTFPTTTVNIPFQNKKGITLISEICDRVGIESYIDYDISTSQWYLNTFIEGAIINTGSSVAYGVNLVGVSDFGKETDDVYNKISVYGKTESTNILLLKTEENDSSQSNLWVKDKIITANDIETMSELQEKVNAELIGGIDSNPTGQVNTVLLHSLRPGEKINVSIPYTGINGLYRVREFTHDIGKNETQITFNKTKDLITDYLISKINSEEFISNLINPNNMKDGYTVYFNEDPAKMEFNYSEQKDSRLQIKNPVGTTVMQGTATSLNLIADYDVTQCEFRIYTNYYSENDTYEVSNQGGATGTWEDITSEVSNEFKNGLIHTFSTPPGKNLKFRITMNRLSSSSPSPVYESVCLLYK